MPMAGRGSRFAKQGIHEPKPLISLYGKPFFWWATESVRRQVSVEELIYVVLQEHIDSFGIGEVIHRYYPEARIVVIPDVTSGAAETAYAGVSAVKGKGRVLAINDCDHAFDAPGLGDAVHELSETLNGALMCFRSDNPAYSYARVDEEGRVTGTVEKVVVSPYAIAGCYLFRSVLAFSGAFDAYKDACEYNELFISGVFNQMIGHEAHIGKVDLSDHVSFGTPAEFALVTPERFRSYSEWAA